MRFIAQSSVKVDAQIHWCCCVWFHTTLSSRLASFIVVPINLVVSVLCTLLVMFPIYRYSSLDIICISKFLTYFTLMSSHSRVCCKQHLYISFNCKFSSLVPSFVCLYSDPHFYGHVLPTALRARQKSFHILFQST